jgi:hypothetical protein
VSQITTYSPLRRALGWAVEPKTAVGTPVAPTGALPFTDFNFNDKPTWLRDMGVRGSMGNDAYGVVQGVLIGEVDFSGSCYLDQLGFLIGNIMGDVTTTGTTIAPTGTLAALANAGATSVQSSVSIPNGTLIQIDVGVNAEIVTTSGVPTGAGPYAVPVPALTKGHASGVQITAISTPNTHAFSLLNSGGGQPTTHTLTLYYGPAATTGTRQFASFVCTELTIKWNVESELVTYSAKGIAWVSNIAAAQFIPTFTTALPVASWRCSVGISGPATGGSQVMNAMSGEVGMKRSAKAYYTAQGTSQNPFIIQRGAFSADWKVNFLAQDEQPLLLVRNGVPVQTQLVFNNGLSGANALGLTVDGQASQFEESKPGFSGEATEWDSTGSYLFNTTNAGYSGGSSPLKVSLLNAMPANVYI